MIEEFVRRELPWLIALLSALLMIASFFLNIPSLIGLAAEVQRAIVPIAATAALVGGFHVLLHNILIIQKRGENWFLSIIFVITFLFFLFTSLIPQTAEINTVLYTAIAGNTTEAMWGLIALFIISMLYRATRVRNIETLLFTLSCAIVLLGNAPIGEVVPGARFITIWLLDIPSMAGMRAITIGVGLGIIAYGIRVMLRRERAVLGEV